MANTLNVSSLVSKGVVAPLHAEGKLVNTCGTRYKKDFLQNNYVPGVTLNVNKGPQFQVTSGRVANVQDVEFATMPVTVVQYNEAISMTSIEQTYSLDSEDSMMQLGQDMGRRMLREVERIGFQTMANAIGNNVGSPGTEPGAMRLFGRGAAFMDDALAPDAERYCALSPLAQAELVDAMKNVPNPGPEIGNQYLRGSMKKAMNLNFYSTPSVFRSTLGSCTNATPLLSSAATNGAATLAVNGLTASTSTIKAGTKFTLGVLGTATAVYAVDPETKATLPYLKMFTVTTDAVGISSAIAALAISPKIYDSTSMHQNVSLLPPINAEVTLLLGTTAAGNTYGQSVIYQKDAIQLIALPLKAARTKGTHEFSDFMGVPIRVGIGAWDPINDSEILRVDACFAWFMPRPDHGCIVAGA